MPRAVTWSGRSGGCWLLVLVLSAPAALAQSPLPKGMLEARPQAWEVETKQAGGHGSASFEFVGTLRCMNSGEVIVGVRVMRSEVVDQIQIGCARVECTDEFACTWKTLDRGAFAGRPNDKSKPSIAVCPHEAAIAGYRARVRKPGGGPVDYVADLQFECARLAAAPLLATGGAADGGVPVADEARTWLPFPAPEGATPPDDANWPVEFRCEQRAATGVSVAVGSYRPTGQAVIQALSLFCARAPALSGMQPESP